MSDPSVQAELSSSEPADLAQAIAMQRLRAKEVAEQHRGRLQALQAELAQRIERVSESVARQEALDAERKRQFEAQQELLSAQAAALQETDRRLRGMEASLQARQAELAAQEAALQQWQATAAQERQAFDAQQAELAAEQSKVEQRRQALEQAQEELARAQAEHTRAQACLEQAQAELAHRQEMLSQREAALTQQQAQLARREATLAQREAELTQREAKLSERAVEIERFTAQSAAPSPEAVTAAEAAASGALQAQRAEFEAQRALLQKRIEELNQQLMAAKDKAADADAWRHKYELALEDSRSLRQKLAEADRRAAQPAAVPTDGRLDWEAQKRRLLRALEQDEDEDAADTEQRSRIKELIEKSDAALAMKQRELDELRALLEAQSGTLGAVAVGATAVEEILNKDELIVQERERLRQLQAEWQEKLRTAEVELSLERARLAREKADLAEQMRLIESERAANRETAPSADGKKQPTRGRWLAFLGLKEGPPNQPQ